MEGQSPLEVRVSTYYTEGYEYYRYTARYPVTECALKNYRYGGDSTR